MMTQTHILIGLCLFGRPNQKRRNLCAIAGGVVPDAAIFLLYAIEKSRGTAESVIWNHVYFSPFWQDVVAWGNSIPLWLTVFIVSVALRIRLDFKAVGGMLFVLAASSLAHLACDFPVHVEDAHRHLFPLSDWRFRSPVSYWDPNHYGMPFAILESLLGVTLAIRIWTRFRSLAARAMTSLLLASYLAIPAWFAWQFLSAS